MKRGPGPARKTPLTAHTPLQSRSELSRSSDLSRSVPLPRAGLARPADTGEGTRGRERGSGTGKARPARDIPALTRLEVYVRDQERCVRCGRVVWAGCRSIQHRAPRGAGGSSADPHRLSNLLTVCGALATDPDGCHAWCETWRTKARASGFLVPMGVSPDEWAVHAHDGWFLYLDDGTRVPTDDPTGGP